VEWVTIPEGETSIDQKSEGTMGGKRGDPLHYLRGGGGGWAESAKRGGLQKNGRAKKEEDHVAPFRC